MRVVAVTPEYAADLVTWHYPAPYDCYDVSDVDPEFFLDPRNGFFALVSGSDELIGFRSFGADGRVPGGDYDDSALDTGGGLRPSLTGQGLGRQAIATGLDFGRRRFAPRAFRVTVASFNSRALRVVTSLGFRPVSSFAATTDGRRFEILVRPEVAPGACSIAVRAGADAGRDVPALRLFRGQAHGQRRRAGGLVRGVRATIPVAARLAAA